MGGRMTTMQNHQRVLVDGPSKFDLMLSLFDKGRKVSFKDEMGMRYIATISMIQAEDGSGESWNLNGSTELVPPGRPLGCGPEHPLRYHFVGYFRTDKRRGHIVLK